MTTTFYVLINIIVLFFFLLIGMSIFNKSKRKFCAICASVFLTWVFFLFLNWINLFNNKVIIALLIGQSITGIYYAIEKKVKEELTLFRLPFLITLTIIGYALLAPKDYIIKNILLLLFLWVLYLFIYLYRNNKNINFIIKKIIECCKRW